MLSTSLWATVLNSPVRRQIFVSYHHKNDQWYYDAFAQQYGKAGYNVVRDNSLRDALDSDDPAYVMQSIRDNHIHGTSCTIVLCGSDTHGRKYVDWEIKGTLDKGHGLIGVWLPTATLTPSGIPVPIRLKQNIDSGYALWKSWQEIMQGPSALQAYVEESTDPRLHPESQIVNSPSIMHRNTAA